MYLFGHNHLQFYTEVEGRFFINPGSCGFPLDYDTRAAYTLLKPVNGSEWQITERRVDYDMNSIFEAMRSSGFSEKFPEWEAIYTRQLQTAADYIGSLVQYLHTTAHILGIENPFDDAVWQEALVSYQF